MVATLLWKYDILPAPAAEPVTPRQHQFCDGDAEDEAFPPLDINVDTLTCNCKQQPVRPTCLVDGLTVHREEEGSEEEEEVQEAEQVLEVLNLSDAEEETSDGDEEAPEEVLYAHTFPVIGSWHERRYQQALNICSYRRRARQELTFRCEPEPDNIKDCNAIKFEVFHNNHWYIMGYCGVVKIPKLKQAMHYNQIRCIALKSLKRKYARIEGEFLLSAALVITKSGQWARDYYRNKYNSVITV